MIPVTPQPEPPDFDVKVRQPGRNYILLNPRASAADLPPLWREMNRTLWETYNGICSYLAVFFEFATGASSTDHFAPKSKNIQDAYEWSNYRLACLAANRRKNTHIVLDPFTMQSESFTIDFLDGEITPNETKSLRYQGFCQHTIEILGLNDPDIKKMRVRHFDDYWNDLVNLEWLQRYSPFVYSEIIRQQLQK